MAPVILRPRRPHATRVVRRYIHRCWCSHLDSLAGKLLSPEPEVSQTPVYETVEKSETKKIESKNIKAQFHWIPLPDCFLKGVITFCIEHSLPPNVKYPSTTAPERFTWSSNLYTAAPEASEAGNWIHSTKRFRVSVSTGWRDECNELVR